jgi:hypothetical protein
MKKSFGWASVLVYFLCCAINVEGFYELVPSEDPDGLHIPNYHFEMILDKNRNDAFYGAIKEAVVPNVSRVLDVGAGMGLLSLMAASAGAKRVTAVERNFRLHELSKTIVAANNLSSCVSFVNKISNEMVIGEDGYLQAANILVSETLDSWVIGEGFLDILADVRSRGLLTEDAIIVPSHGKLFGQLVYRRHSRVRSQYQALTPANLDFSPLERHISPAYFVENSNVYVTKNFSEPVLLLEFNFQNFSFGQEGYFSKHLPFTDDGVANAIVFYFDICCDSLCKYSITNSPGSDSHWQQMMYVFDANVVATPGASYHLLGTHVSSRYVFANAGQNQRIVQVKSSCAYHVEIWIFNSTLYEHCSFTNQEQCAFLFSLGSIGEWNYWVVQRDQQVLLAQYLDADRHQDHQIFFRIPPHDDSTHLQHFDVSC